MKDTHTQGKWYVDCRQSPLCKTSNNLNGEKITIRARKGLAEVESVCDLRTNNGEANAKLIAAAPEMLERLEYVVSWLDDAKVHATIVNFCKETIKKATK